MYINTKNVLLYVKTRQLVCQNNLESIYNDERPIKQTWELVFNLCAIWNTLGANVIQINYYHVSASHMHIIKF